MASPGGRQDVARVTAKAAGSDSVGSGVQSGTHPTSAGASSDTAYDDPGDFKGIMGKRDMKLPWPSPSNHDDVLPWHAKFMDIIGIG